MPLNRINIKQINGLQQQLSKSLSDVLNIGNTASRHISMGTYSIIFDNSSFNGSLSTFTLSSNRIWELPNQSGTIALISDISNVSILNDLSDVTISSATLNDTFRYNGTNWVNTSNVTIDSGGNMEVQGSVIVQGNVTINGTTSTINTQNLLVEDPLILLASTQSGSPTLDSGLMIKRGTGITQSFIWDESLDEFAVISTNDSHNTQGNVGIVGYSKLRVGDFITEGSTIINTSSSTSGDFVVKTATYADFFFIDASTDRLGIGGAATLGFVDIANKIDNGSVIRASNTNASAYTLRMVNTDGTVTNSSFRNSGRVDLAQNGAVTYMGNQTSNYLLQSAQITTQFSNVSSFTGFHANRNGTGIALRGSSANGNSYISSTGRMWFDTGWNNNPSSNVGIIAMVIDASQNVGIGLATNLTDADARLHVIGPTGSAFKLEDGTQGAGYILVSDANGMASWTASISSGGVNKEVDVRSYTASVTESITHTLSTSDIIVQCYNSSGSQIIPNDVTITGATGVNINFTSTLSSVKTVIIG